MKHRSLVPSLFLVSFVASFLPAQTAPPSTDTRLAQILRLPALQPGDWQALFSLAESGDPEAQYGLGRIYEAGRILSLDKEKSAYWYQKSADQGYAPAAYWVCGKRANQDGLEHERCLWRAAAKGVPEAQFWLSVAFDQRLWFGVTDEQEALRGFRKAAEHAPDRGGAGQGRNNLGILYADGDGVPNDYVQAYMWFSLAGIDKNIAWMQHKMTAEQTSRAQQLAADWKLQHPDPAIY